MLTDSNFPTIEISGTDYSDNTGELPLTNTDINFTIVKPGKSYTIRNNSFEISLNKGSVERNTPIVSSNLPMELTYPENVKPLSTPISITPANLQFLKNVNLKALENVNYEDAALYKYSVNSWNFISKYSSKMEIPETGIYCLFSEQMMIEEGIFQKPQIYHISSPYPNPFNNTTVIKYQLPVNSVIELSVYNIIGEKITVLNKGLQNQGYHNVKWNGRDDNNNQMPSGIYFIRLQTDNTNIIKKITLLK